MRVPKCFKKSKVSMNKPPHAQDTPAHSPSPVCTFSLLARVVKRVGQGFMDHGKPVNGPDRCRIATQLAAQRPIQRRFVGDGVQHTYW